MRILSRNLHCVVLAAVAATLVACSQGDSFEGSGASSATSNPLLGYQPSGKVILRGTEPDGTPKRAGKATPRLPRAVPGAFLVKFKRHASRASALSALGQRRPRARRRLPRAHAFPTDPLAP